MRTMLVVPLVMLFLVGLAAADVHEKIDIKFAQNASGTDKRGPSDVAEYMDSLKGKVIAEGKKLENGNCWTNYSITGWGDSNYLYGRINITVADDCKVIVSDVALEKTEYYGKPSIDGESENKRLDSQQEPFSIQSAVEREGWAENRTIPYRCHQNFSGHGLLGRWKQSL